MRTVALDLGLNSIDWCEVSNGQVVARGRVDDLRGIVGVLDPDKGRAQVGFEACRESRHVYELVRSLGHEPKMIDTTRVRQIGVGSHGRKNDRLDAEKLAVALERGHVALAHVLSREAHELRELQEVHRALTETRSRLITNVRGLLRGRGVILPSCAPESFPKMLTELGLPEPLQVVVAPLKVMLEPLNKQISTVVLRIEELCTSRPDGEIERLASVPGVSVLVAAAFISVIDDARRFHRASEVVSYLGLCPSEHTTGGKQRLGAITKCGNSYARWMLVQSAWCMLRSREVKDPLVRWAHRVAQRRGRMRAAVAVARRIARTLWALWRDGTYYDAELDRERANQRVAGEAEPDRAARSARAQKAARRKLDRARRAHLSVLAPAHD